MPKKRSPPPSLESHAKRDAERARRRVRETAQRLAEVRSVVPIHSLHRRRRERVELLIRGRRIGRRQDALVDPGDYDPAPVGEDIGAAATELEAVEQVQHLHLSKEFEVAGPSLDTV